MGMLKLADALGTARAGCVAHAVLTCGLAGHHQKRTAHPRVFKRTCGVVLAWHRGQGVEPGMHTV